MLVVHEAAANIACRRSTRRVVGSFLPGVPSRWGWMWAGPYGLIAAVINGGLLVFWASRYRIARRSVQWSNF